MFWNFPIWPINIKFDTINIKEYVLANSLRHFSVWSGRLLIGHVLSRDNALSLCF